MALTLVAPDETKVLEFDGRQTLRYFGKSSPHVDTNSEAHRASVHNRTLKAHFHKVDQFQIFCGAPGGTYQRSEISDFTVQYTDAYCTYGPVIAGEDPVYFFTLRAEASKFIGYMPGSRDELSWNGRRHYLKGFDRLGKEGLPPTGSVSTETLIEKDGDGLEAQAILAGANSGIKIPDTHGTNGAYVFVAEGSVSKDGKSYGEQTVGWIDADEGPEALEAGPDGARLFVFKFPTPSTSEQHKMIEAGASV